MTFSFSSSFEPRFTSVPALLDADEVTPLKWVDFDTQLWLLLCSRIESPRDLERMPVQVSHYFASRRLAWEVMNGGFAQAAFNTPEWFERAEAGYRALGRARSADLIRRAREQLPRELANIESNGLSDASIEEVFESFDESPLSELNAEIPGEEWECDEARVAYAREHRAAFRAVTG